MGYRNVGGTGFVSDQQSCRTKDQALHGNVAKINYPNSSGRWSVTSGMVWWMMKGSRIHPAPTPNCLTPSLARHHNLPRDILPIRLVYSVQISKPFCTYYIVFVPCAYALLCTYACVAARAHVNPATTFNKSISADTEGGSKIKSDDILYFLGRNSCVPFLRNATKVTPII